MKELSQLFDIKLLKFLFVGVLNTLVGCGLMFLLYNVFGVSYWVSSASNYVAGGVLSYFLNKYFTFKNKGRSFKQVMFFVLNLAVCYFAAYIVAKKAVYFLMGTYTEKVRDNVSMACGMCLYTGLNYLGQRLLVFVDRKGEAHE